MKFQEVFDRLLLALEQHPDCPVEDVWRQLAEELGLSDADIAQIDLANQLIDGFGALSAEMENARKEGMSRQKFVSGKLDKIIEKTPEDKREMLIRSVKEAGNRIFDNNLAMPNEDENALDR